MFLKSEIEKLEQQIKTQATKYYSEGTQDVSDEEFDKMVDTLREQDPDSAVLRPGWGYDPNENMCGDKRQHKYGEVGSLDKCHNWQELRPNFRSAATTDGNLRVASLKLDGISVVLYYTAGKLDYALTRGDGHIGIDITDKVLKIAPRLDQIQDYTTFTGAVRGEILMKYSDFARYKEKDPTAANPRNVTAGLIGRNEVTDDLNYLTIVFYRIIGSESTLYNSYLDILSALFNMFGNVVPYDTVSYEDDETLQEAMYNLRDRWYRDYPADGIVISLNTAVRDVTSYEISYDAMAFKFPAEQKQCRVVDVEWNLSKTRYLIPRVRIEPVELSGTKVEWCTGFNAEFIRERGIGKDAIVTVTKSGEIIPNIVNVVKPTAIAYDCRVPTICPECLQLLRWNGVHLQCDNSECANASRQDLSVWLETLAPVDGLKDVIKFKFLEELFGTTDLTIERVMNLEPEYTTVTSVPPRTHKMLFTQMLDKLFNQQGISVATVWTALNIPRVGEISAKKLATSGVTYGLICEVKAGASLEELQAHFLAPLTAAVGQASAGAILSNLNKLKRFTLISADRIDWNLKESAEPTKVAVTGKLSVPRAQFEKELAKFDFTLADICRDTAFLITDDPNSNSAKNQKADKLGVPKITEVEFRARFM